MKRIVLLLLALALAVLPALGGGEEEGLFRIRDGMAQPVLHYSDPRAPGYTNRDSDILRFVVYVETDHDTDLDGKPDLIKTLVQVPRAAAEGRCRVPAIYEARPYIAGMYTWNPTLPPVGSETFDEGELHAAPEKRTVAGETNSLALAAAADPADWYYQLEHDPFGQEYLGNLTAYDDLLVRGFAVVQSAGLGTWGSEGLVCCGSDVETAAFRCVVEWLTGDRNAFSDPAGCIRVPADWCSGRVGMTGRSYAGAMAFQVAATGVKGLETVVPVAGVASWYDYNNAQGAPSGLLSSYDALADLSILCASRFPDGADAPLTERCLRYLAHLRDEQIRLAGDYGPFWAARDWTAPAAFRASALIIQGLNDETVRPKQFDLMRSAFLAAGCPVRCLLHQNGHVTPANEQTRTDIMIGSHTCSQWLNLWFTHTLLGVENEAAALPPFLVQSNVDGVFRPALEWNTGHGLELLPGDTQQHTISARGALMSNAGLLRETLDGSEGPTRGLWRMDVDREITVNGPAVVHLRAMTRDTDKPMLMMGAVLVDQAEEPFPCFDTGSIGVLPQEVIVPGGVERGEGPEPYDLVRWQQTTANRKIIAYGTLDLRNPDAGYLPASATPAGEPLEAGSWHDYTLYLQPTFYTLPAGHRLELYIVPFCGFSDDAAVYDSFSPAELAEMSIDPQTLVPFTRDYAFTVDYAASSARIPILR